MSHDLCFATESAGDGASVAASSSSTLILSSSMSMGTTSLYDDASPRLSCVIVGGNFRFFVDAVFFADAAICGGARELAATAAA
jgi:hypothetical protein